VTGILAFHDIDSHLRPGITNISPRSLGIHLDWMLSRGWEFCNLSDLSERSSGAKMISVTFDDAMEGQLEAALPRLLERNIKATAFVVTSFVGRKAAWDYSAGSRSHAGWTLLQEWISAGMQIGSHTCTHRDLRKLSTSELNAELTASRGILEDRILRSVTQIAYPFGRWNTRVKKCVAEAGYLQGMTTRAQLSFHEPLALPRVLVSRLDTPLAIERRLKPTPWGQLERIKQDVVGAWAGGTIRMQQLRGDYRAGAGRPLPGKLKHRPSKQGLGV
jgi:peptidoglycan/xylan/chitin deacetylase (PgdA/CDA1 family)